MAGGTFVTMNKIRPGAYINFKSVPRPLSSIGDRGIMTMPVPMTWGAENKIIELYSTDLTDGKSLAKIGVSAFDRESLIYRQALSKAYLGYIYRVDTGATRATAEIGTLTVSAKYGGTTGNKIAVVIAQNSNKYDVVTIFNGYETDRQTVSDIGELLPNDYVTFTGTGEPEETAGTFLAGAMDGTVKADHYAKYFDLIGNYKPWNTMAIPSEDDALPPITKDFIVNMRDKLGKKVQAVVINYPAADHEGIISVNQGYETKTETIGVKDFCAYVAGMTAGTELAKSNTYAIVEGAAEIIKPVDEYQVGDMLKAGNLLLARRSDGEIVIEQDINTYHSYTPDKNYEFCKNFVIRTIDNYNNDIRRIFENNYIGKVVNNDTGRSVFKADVVSYLKSLQSLGCITNFSPDTDVSISSGQEVDEVVLDIWIQPTDAMEKLYNTVYLRPNA